MSEKTYTFSSSCFRLVFLISLPQHIHIKVIATARTTPPMMPPTIAGTGTDEVDWPLGSVLGLGEKMVVVTT